MGSNKWVHILFFAAATLVAMVLHKTIEWVWSAFGKPNDTIVPLAAIALAGTAGYVSWKNPSVHNLAGEVVTELRKVTWPTHKETKLATVVVMITVVIAAIILGLFDMIWSWATSKLYG